MTNLIDINPKVQYLPLNTLGKDYVVGDLHGCYVLLILLLHQIKFNPNVDRLISVGDLVDRGNDSLECFNLLNRTWFHSVLGNHEDLLRYSVLLFLSENQALPTKYNAVPLQAGAVNHFMNGGKWVGEAGLTIELAMNWLVKLNSMPIILVVGKDTNSRYNVVHSELLSYGNSVSDDMIDSHSNDLDSMEMIWGRNIFAQNPMISDETQSKDLSITFSGHTIQDKIEKRARQVNIDTCAFYADFISMDRNGTHGLTIVEPMSMTFTTINGATKQFTTGPV